MVTTRRLLTFLVASLAVAALIPASAVGRTYAVVACDAAPDGVTNASWSDGNIDGARFEFGSGCSGPQGGEHAGLYVREIRNQPGNVPAGVSAYWTFTAPDPAITITGLSYRRYARTNADNTWIFELRTDTGILESCRVSALLDPCVFGALGGGEAAQVTFGDLSTSTLSFGPRCSPSAPETTCTDGGTLHRVSGTIYAATVTLSDPVPPDIGSLGGSLFSGGWLRGTHNATFSASDATGIDQLQLLRDRRAAAVDDQTIAADDDRSCDFTLALPCASPGEPVIASWGQIDTTAWPDGVYNVVGRATDAASNATASQEPVTVRVDNTAPAPPTSMTGADPAWSNAASRNLSWTLPGGQASPVVAATVRLCTPNNTCTDTNAATLIGHTVQLAAGSGVYTGSVFLTDEAGNVAPSLGAGFTLRYDADAPAFPVLGAAEPQSVPRRFRMPVSLSDPGPAPLLGLQVELCRADGSECRPVATEGFSQVVFDVPEPGSWTLRVRAVDAAGNVGPTATRSITLTSVQPTVTPGPTRRRLSGLVDRSRLTSTRVVVRAALSADATGRVRVTYRARVRGRTWIVRRTLHVRRGRAIGTLRIPRSARSRRARLRLSYSGDARYLPQTLRKTLRRR